MNNALAFDAPANGHPLKAITKIYAIAINSWLLFPAFFYYHEVWQNLANIPVMDDFNMPLEYVINFSKQDLWGKVTMIFAQHSEHKIVPSKLLYISYYYLTGELNFRVLGFIGDLQLLMVAFAGIHFIKKYIKDSWKLPACIWMLVVFDLNTYENATMCMNGVANYGVICYFFAALYFYDKHDKWIPMAILFQFLCIFSNANGLVAGILIAICNIAGPRRKRIISLLASCVFVGLFFIGYHTVTLPNKLPFNVNTSMTFFVRQSGAHFNFDHSLIVGSIVLLLIPFIFPWRRLFKATFTPILCIFLFAISTMVLTAIFRSCYVDARFNTSRYMIYPQMLIGCLCLFVWMRLRSPSQKWVGGTIILGMMLTAYVANFQFGKLGFERTNYRATTRKFWHPHQDECERICKEACERNIYCIDDHR